MKTIQRMALAAALGFAAALPAAHAANLLTNGDFETGDLTGWTLTGESDATGIDPFAAHGGTYGAYFGPTDPGGIEQQIATVAGQTYKVDFWLELDDSAQPNSFTWSWNGVAQSPSFVNVNGFDYVELSTLVKATGAATTVGFTFTNPQSFWLLDDVSVAAAVPEPTSALLMALGLAVFAGVAVRRRHR